MLSTWFVIISLANDTLGQLVIKNILNCHRHLDDLLPHWIKRTLDRLRFLWNTLTVKSDKRVAVSLNVCRWEIFSFVKIKNKQIIIFFLENIFNRSVCGYNISKKVYFTSDIPSNLVAFEHVQWFIALKLINAMIFVSRTCSNITSLNSFKTHPVILLLPVTKVKDYIRHLLDILRELHLFVL